MHRNTILVPWPSHVYTAYKHDVNYISNLHRTTIESASSRTILCGAS